MMEKWRNGDSKFERVKFKAIQYRLMEPVYGGQIIIISHFRAKKCSLFVRYLKASAGNLRQVQYSFDKAESLAEFY